MTQSGNYLIKKNVTDEPNHYITGSIVMDNLIYNVPLNDVIEIMVSI